MKKRNNTYRFLFAGGGTGGHIFPALAVAENIRILKPDAEFLFIGTNTKIESVVVPKAGFNFKSIWIKGFARKFDLQNILFPLKVLVSAIQSLIINMSFKPRVAIGSGGYVSGPAVWAASVMGAKVILLEQNSYPGLTTRLLEKRAEEIHLSFEDSKKYLRDKNKSAVTGNPVRASLNLINRKEAINKFGLDEARKTILVLGGSLGARSINEAVASNLDLLKENNIQVIWQTGRIYFHMYKRHADEMIWVNDFIDDMSAAFSACDLVVSRAGATTIAEVSNLGLAAVFIPSPNVAADHQYYNAKSIADENAAVLLKDNEAAGKLGKIILEIIADDKRMAEFRRRIKKFSRPDAALVIAKSAIKMAEVA